MQKSIRFFCERRAVRPCDFWLEWPPQDLESLHKLGTPLPTKTEVCFKRPTYFHTNNGKLVRNFWLVLNIVYYYYSQWDIFTPTSSEIEALASRNWFIYTNETYFVEPIPVRFRQHIQNKLILFY